MELRTDTFDLWFFHRGGDEPRYLLVQTSQEKADRWFDGGRFWQTPPGDRSRQGESAADAIRRRAAALGLELRGAWAAEHAYVIWNRRHDALMLIPVFAAEVAEAKPIPLGWESSDQDWFTAAECGERLYFRGLEEGLRCVREYVSEVAEPAPMLRVV